MVAPLALAGGLVIAAFFGAFVSGCDDGEQEEAHSKPAPKADPCVPPPQPDAFLHLRNETWTAMSLLWPDEVAEPRQHPWLDAWLGNSPKRRLQHHRSRSSLAAFAPLARLMCERGIDLPNPHLVQYRQGMTRFFSAYYRGESHPSDDAILVLLGGLAPTNLGEDPASSERILFDALDALEPHPFAVVSGERSTSAFPEVLKAGYHFNRAAEIAGSRERYVVDRRGAHVLYDRCIQIRQELREMKRGLDRLPLHQLNDDQISFVETMREAAQSLGTSLRTTKRRVNCTDVYCLAIIRNERCQDIPLPRR